MKIKVKFFAILREHTGKSEMIKEVPGGSTVKDLWKSLVGDFPVLEGREGHLLFAVNREYVKQSHELKDQDELALIPPVSGGCHV